MLLDEKMIKKMNDFMESNEILMELDKKDLLNLVAGLESGALTLADSSLGSSREMAKIIKDGKIDQWWVIPKWPPNWPKIPGFPWPWPIPMPFPGIPAPIWMRLEKNIAEFVKASKLVPLTSARKAEFVQELTLVAPVAKISPLISSSKITAERAKVAELVTSRGALRRIPVWWNGGIHCSHLHLGGEIYELTPVQWSQFAGKTIDILSASLAKANSISFDKFMQISDVVEM
jgi:hypothetical protein